MTYESWRITYQDSEQAARAAYSGLLAANAEISRLKMYEPGSRAPARRTDKGVTDMEKQQNTEAQQEAVPLDCKVRGLIDRMQARADNAYVAYIGDCGRSECLGWEAKTERGIFGEAELKAHKTAAEKLGRHRAMQEAANLLRELLTSNV